MNYLDIETVKNDRADEYFETTTIQPRANLVDPEKIKQDILNKRAAMTEKAGLFWWTGKIICIGCYESITGQMRILTGTTTDSPDGDERALLNQFYEMLDNNIYDFVTGKQTADFDVPFIKGRALAHDLGTPKMWYPKRLDDVDHYFSRSRACQQLGSLNKYAWGLGMPMKKGHGSQVQGMYDRVKLEPNSAWVDIMEYCRLDVQLTANILSRIYKPFKQEAHHDAAIQEKHSEDGLLGSEQTSVRVSKDGQDNLVFHDDSGEKGTPVHSD